MRCPDMMRRASLIFFFCSGICICFPLSEAFAEEVVGRAPIQSKIWGKDPFSPPFKKTARADKISGGPLKLNGILYSGKQASAIVNGKTVRVGDAFDGYKVLIIKEKYVVLTSIKGRYKLELGR